MAKPPKLYTYGIFFAISLATLSGCSLQRDQAQVEAQPATEQSLPPTLAPLGADTSDLDSVVAPTTINVQPTATNSSLDTSGTNEQTLPTTQAIDLSSEIVTSDIGEEEAAAQPEVFTPPSAEQASSGEPIIVSVKTEDELPSGGPIAVNPPASQTVGNYAAPAAPISGGDYTVRYGDTLFTLSQAYGTTIEAIMQANGLTSETIYEGQNLVIPGYDGYSAPVYNPVAAPQDGLHIVNEGETLFSIALRYGTTVEALAAANYLINPDAIYPGQTLHIVTAPDQTFAAPAPGNGLSHTVSAGETLFFISQRYGVSMQVLVAANGLLNPDDIQAGQVLIIP